MSSSQVPQSPTYASWSPTAQSLSAAPSSLGAGNYDWLNAVGINLSIGGALTGIAGTYYGLKAQQGQLKAEAQNAEFAANQADIAARAAEREASDVIYAGQRAAAWRGAQEAADVASLRAGTAASGVEVGTGSAGELERSARIAAEVDKRAIRTNAERQAAAIREGGANMRGAAVMGRTSADNMRTSAKTINPIAGAAGQTLSSAGTLIGQRLVYSGRR